MNKEQLMNALKEHGVDVAAIEAQNAASNARVQELENKIKELAALPAQKEQEITNLKGEVEKLKGSIVAKEKEDAFNVLIAEGKVIPAQKESILNTFDSAEKIKAFFKDSPVVVSLKPAGSNGDGEDETLTEAEEQVVASGMKTKEEILANRKIGFNKKK